MGSSGSQHIIGPIQPDPEMQNIYLQVKINNDNARAMVDTGAVKNCCSHEFCDRHHIPIKDLEQGDVTVLRGADGRKLKMMGRATVPLNLRGIATQVKCYVVDKLTTPLLLSGEFLAAAEASIDYKRKLVSFYDGMIKMQWMEAGPSAAHVALIRATTLPARSETIIPVQITKKIFFPENLALIETAPVQEGQNFAVARILVKPKQDRTFCRIVNPTDGAIRLGRGHKIGTIESVGGYDVDDGDDDYDEVDEEEYEDIEEDSDNYKEVRRGSTHKADMIPPTLGVKPAGKYTFEQLGMKIDNPDLTPEQRQGFIDIVNEFGDIFAMSLADIPGTKVFSHHVDTGNAAPVRRKPYKCSPEAQKEIQRQVDEMKALGIVEPSSSLWNSSTLLVRKRDNTARLCIDYRGVNKLTKKVSCVMPDLDDVMLALSDPPKKIFTICDLKSGYWQLPMASEEDRDKTTFVCNSESLRFTVMPFGLASAPQSFILLMNRVLRGLNMRICVAYLDDLLIFSDSIEGHKEDLRKVFTRLREATLRLHPQKTLIGLRRVPFLGMTLSDKGLEVDESKIERLRNWKEPGNLSLLRNFLGFTSYLRKFVPNYAGICAPLYQLTKEGVPYVFGPEQKAAFKLIIEKLCSPPVLAYPDCKRAFSLYVDASTQALGWILMQKGDDGQEHIIALGSRMLRGAEKRYGISELESLAMVEGLKANRHLLSNGITHRVWTDHVALCWLNNLKFSGNNRLHRYSLFISGFNIEIKHKPGLLNRLPDSLSRAECPDVPAPTGPVDEGDGDVEDEVVVFSVTSDRGDRGDEVRDRRQPSGSR